MLFKWDYWNVCRISSLQSSKKRVTPHLDRSYNVMIISNEKFPSLSHIRRKFDANFVTKFHKTAKLFVDYESHMDGSGDRTSFTVDFEEVLQAQNDNNILIIDVREQKEIDETGKFPGSIHIPMGNIANVMLHMSETEFEKEFGKFKPNENTKIILSCRSGIRSATVQQLLQKLGYNNAFNYVGGWLEWESKQK